MADLYLCGKDTGLVPLYDDQGRHIDCVKPGAQKTPDSAATQSTALVVSTPPSSASGQTSAPQRKLRAFKLPVVAAQKGKDYFAMAAKLPDMRSAAPQVPVPAAQKSEQAAPKVPEEPSSDVVLAEAPGSSSPRTGVGLYVAVGLGVIGLGGLAYVLMQRGRQAKPNRRKRRRS